MDEQDFISRNSFKFKFVFKTLELISPHNSLIYNQYLHQAFPLDIRKKTQGEKNSELKKETQTQAKNSTFRHLKKNTL